MIKHSNKFLLALNLLAINCINSSEITTSSSPRNTPDNYLVSLGTEINSFNKSNSNPLDEHLKAKLVLMILKFKELSIEHKKVFIKDMQDSIKIAEFIITNNGNIENLKGFKETIGARNKEKNIYTPGCLMIETNFEYIKELEPINNIEQGITQLLQGLTKIEYSKRRAELINIVLKAIENAVR